MISINSTLLPRLLSMIFLLISSILFYIASTSGGTIQSETTDLYVVFDITQSMNAQDEVFNVGYIPVLVKKGSGKDVKGKGKAKDIEYVEDISLKVSRLDYAKKSFKETVKLLPCGWKVGIGIFSANEVLPLFHPIEVCDNISTIGKVVDNIQWYNIWGGDSYIASGLRDTINQAEIMKSRYIFITDGDPYPKGTNAIGDLVNQNEGIMAVLGSDKPIAIPKYSEEGKHIGFWGTGKGDRLLPEGLKMIMSMERDESVADFDSERLLSSEDKNYVAEMARLSNAKLLHNPTPIDYVNEIKKVSSTGITTSVSMNKQEYVLPALIFFILGLFNYPLIKLYQYSVRLSNYGSKKYKYIKSMITT